MSKGEPKLMHDSGLVAAVARHDADIAGLRDTVTQLASAFQRFESNVDRSLADITKQIAMNQKAPWALLLAGAAVIVAFFTSMGGILWAGYAKESNRIEMAMVKFAETYLDQAKADARLEVAVDQHHGEIGELDKRLQRETDRAANQALENVQRHTRSETRLDLIERGRAERRTEH